MPIELETSFDIGEDIILRADFTDADEAPANPSELEVTAGAPDGEILTVEMTEESTGVFTGTVTPVDGQAGRWWWRVYFVGDRAHVSESLFFVRYRRVPESEGS